MLQTLREKPAVRKGVLWVVVGAMMLGIGIGVTAVLGDLLGTGNGANSASGPWILKVGPETIGPAEFESELRRAARDMERLGLSESPEFQARARIDAMQRLVLRSLELQEARKLGLSVTDQEVSDFVHTMPELQRDGLFIGAEEYRRLLAANSVDVAVFEQGVRTDLLLRKWQSTVTAGAIVTDAEVDDEVAKRNQKVRFDFVLASPSKFKAAGEVTPAEVQAWYDGHPDRYQRSEARRARYLLVDVSENDSQIPKPTEEEMKAAYEADKARYGATFEQSKDAVNRQLLFQRAQSEADRRAAVLRATMSDAGSFDAAAAKAGLTVADSGAIRREGELPGGLGSEFVDAVFRTPQGSIGGPVRTMHGDAIFTVSAIEPPRKATLEESRADIVSDLTRDKERQAAMAAASKAVQSAGSDLSAVAKALGETMQQGPLVAKGEAVPGIGYDAAVERAAFAAESGTIAPPVATQTGSVVVLKVAQKQFPDPSTLTGDRAKIREELLGNRQLALVQSIIEAARKATEIKTNEEYLRQYGA